MKGAGRPFNGDTFLEAEFLKLRDKYKLTHVIETGTYHGDTTKWLATMFFKVRTIESNLTNLKIAGKNLAGFMNLTIAHGDSSRDLSKMLPGMEDSLLIFLDAHWNSCPLAAEFEQIAAAGIKPVIVVHDVFNETDPSMGFDTYPEMDYRFENFKPYLDKIYGIGGYEHYFNTEATGERRGCLFVIPKSEK